MVFGGIGQSDAPLVATWLAQMDPRRGQVIELCFFGGLTVEETASVLNISPQSVMRDWKLARACRLRELR